MDEACAGFDMADGVVVPCGVSIVCLGIIGQDDTLEPLDGFVAVAVGDNHADRGAAFRCEPLVVELVAEDDGILARRVFQHPVYRRELWNRCFGSSLW